MKKLILLFAIAASASVFAASPAATQQWVRNYVATNTTTGGVTEQWVRDYLATNLSAIVNTYEADLTSSNSTEGIVRAYDVACANIRLSCTNEAYVSESLVTNISDLVFATLGNGWQWTNAVSDCLLEYSSFWQNWQLSGRATWPYYYYGKETNGTIRLVHSEITNNVVTIWSTKVSDKRYKEAKGE